MSFENKFYSSKTINLFPEKCFNEWMENGLERTFKKGELISTPENSTNYVFIIKRGHACEFHIHIDGKECVIGLLLSGDMIGLTNVFIENESRIFSKALIDVTVIAVPKQEIRTLVEQNPSIAMALLKHFSEKHEDMVGILEQIGYGRVEKRLIFLFEKIIDINREDNGWYPIAVSIAHKDIAAMIASTRETVTLTINKLLKDGVIKHHENSFWIQLKG